MHKKHWRADVLVQSCIKSIIKLLCWYSMPPHDSMLSRYSMYNLYNHLWFAVQPFIVHCLLLLVCLWHHYCCPFMKRKVFSWPWLRNVTHPSLANQENISLKCKQRRACTNPRGETYPLLSEHQLKSDVIEWISLPKIHMIENWSTCMSFSLSLCL